MDEHELEQDPEQEREQESEPDKPKKGSKAKAKKPARAKLKSDEPSGSRKRRGRRKRPKDEPSTEEADTQRSPLDSFSGRVAIVEDSSVAVVELSAATAESSTSLPPAASFADALAAAGKAVGRKGVVVLASGVQAVSLGSDRAEHAGAGRVQAALFASEHFDPDSSAAQVGSLVVSPDIDDDSRDALRALLKRRMRVVPVVACVPGSTTGAVWVRIGRSRVDMTLVDRGEARDVHSVKGHGTERYRELLESSEDRDSAQQQWCSEAADAIAGFPRQWTDLLRVEAEVVVTGPVLADAKLAGLLAALIRSRVKLRAVEGSAALAGLASVSPRLGEPACAHAVTAALAVGSQARLAVSSSVLNEPRRKVRRIVAAAVAGWVLVWTGLGWVSQQEGLSTEAELAAVNARIAQAEEALASEEALDDFNAAEAKERYELLAAPGPDWGRYLRWAHATDHSLFLDRSGQSTATIHIEAASVDEYLQQRITALEWLDCFARAVFDRQGFARSASRGVQFNAALPLTGTSEERIRFEPESAVWGVNPIDPIDGVAPPAGVEDAAPGSPASLDREAERDCGPSPPHVRGLSDQAEPEERDPDES
ncbi:MAG: hypothetical protein F4Z31_01725 [Gemmatimonadetes bacterium]|nr:hypothetical protein [Gemmatimonadota bacterium]